MKGEDELGHWQTKEVVVLADIVERHPSKVFSDLGQIHPRTNLEWFPPNLTNPLNRAPGAPTPEMIPPGNTRMIPIANFVCGGGIFHIRGPCARMRQRVYPRLLVHATSWS
jgi:hypothetical protein